MAAEIRKTFQLLNVADAIGGLGRGGNFILRRLVAYQPVIEESRAIRELEKIDYSLPGGRRQATVNSGTVVVRQLYR